MRPHPGWHQAWEGLLGHTFFLSLDVPICVMEQHPLPRPLSLHGDGRVRHEGIPLLIEPHRPHRLKPFTSYKFRVKATNDIGDSEFSEESEPLTTLQAGQCPPTRNSFSWPTCSSWALGILFGGEGPPKVGGAEGPLALCLALWAGPKEVWARGAFAVGSGPHAKPSNLMCSFSAVPKLVANPRKPAKRLGRGGLSSSSSRHLWLPDQEEGALGSWVQTRVRAPGPLLPDLQKNLLPVASRGPKPQPPELMCLSLSPAPDEAPTIVSVTPHTTTSVLIRWQVRPSRQGGSHVPGELRHALCGDQKGDSPQQGWNILHTPTDMPLIPLSR